MADEDIMPFVVFCHGKDFEPGSYIIDRVAAMAHFRPGNTINVYKANGLGGLTWYYNETELTAQQKYDIMYTISSIALKYYINKFGLMKNIQI